MRGDKWIELNHMFSTEPIVKSLHPNKKTANGFRYNRALGNYFILLRFRALIIYKNKTKKEVFTEQLSITTT